MESTWKRNIPGGEFTGIPMVLGKIHCGPEDHTVKMHSNHGLLEQEADIQIQKLL